QRIDTETMAHDEQTDLTQHAPTGAEGTDAASILPAHRDLYYGGGWHRPLAGRYFELTSPGTGESLGNAAEGATEDVDAAVAGAQQAFLAWREVPPLERAKSLRRFAAILRD